MVSDNLELLHQFAEKVGLNKCWFRVKKNKTKNRKQPHYDVRSNQYQQMLDAGAIPVTRKDLWMFLDKHYANKS